MIIGTHIIIGSAKAKEARAFFKKVLGLSGVDAGEGWLIFTLPPGEIAAHPAGPGDAGKHELYLMCDDIHATLAELKQKGAKGIGKVHDRGWGFLSEIDVPGAGKLGIYQPRHPMAIDVKHGLKKAKARPAGNGHATPARSGSKSVGKPKPRRAKR